MDRIGRLVLAAALGFAVLPGVSAQTDTRISTPRDAQDRKDIDRDRDDAKQSVERDQCGDLTGADKERCISDAYLQRNRTSGLHYRAPSPSSGTPMQSVAPSPGMARSGR